MTFSEIIQGLFGLLGLFWKGVLWTIGLFTGAWNSIMPEVLSSFSDPTLKMFLIFVFCLTVAPLAASVIFCFGQLMALCINLFILFTQILRLFWYAITIPGYMVVAAMSFLIFRPLAFLGLCSDWNSPSPLLVITKYAVLFSVNGFMFVTLTRWIFA